VRGGKKKRAKKTERKQGKGKGGYAGREGGVFPIEEEEKKRNNLSAGEKRNARKHWGG